ncbi:MAG: phosphoribosylamine--glycine ligase [Bacteroidia bacterium]|nr:phosphoribosylamine--glycine ligase [Bacteroidia bacterium]
MNILLLGSGGREHALAWKVAQSPLCDQLYIAPGNAGTSQIGKNLAIGVSDFEAQDRAVEEHNIQMIIVGPEQPLVDGVYDYFSAKGIPVFGPSKAAAELEGSKDYSKKFMQKYGIPTAAYASFDQSELNQALEYLEGQSYPLVVKASGLAAGKGVLICETKEEAILAVQGMLSGSSFGEAGNTIVIEEFLKGIEISIFVLTDGKDYVLLPSAKDYKRIGEGDTGLNTGGMGAISPVPFADESFIKEVEELIVKPTMKGIREEQLDYKGFIFIGLMIVDGKAYVLEYNVRMGDPETEVVIPRLQSDLLDLILKAQKGELAGSNVEVDARTCATVMLVSGGYPEAYQKGKQMRGMDEVKDSILFYAGTKEENGHVLTNGGRVIAITSFGDNIKEAVAQSLAEGEKISFEGKYNRNDIGFDLV